MNILAIECSAAPVSAAITSDGKLVSYAFSNIPVTHSETLIPIIQNVLSNARIKINDIDCFAVANGPGSFTGVRIGIAAVKGLAAAKSTKCIAVSTLYGMAIRFITENAVICPVMDARRNQVYNALFMAKNGELTRLCEDRALSCEELYAELKKYNEKIIICGDGAKVFWPYAKEHKNVVLASNELIFQNAAGVAAAAEAKAKREEFVSPCDLVPCYLRLSQAERELKRKE